MKVQSNPNPGPNPGKKSRVKNDLKAKLSNDAFYLIALALLLKKESGDASLRHYLLPKQRSAA